MSPGAHIAARIAHATRLRDEHGGDLDEYLDGIAAEALVRMFPGEALLSEPRTVGKYALSEHVHDALLTASFEVEEESGARIRFGLTDDGLRLYADVDGVRWLHPTTQQSAAAGQSILATYERMQASDGITVSPESAGWVRS